MARTAFQVTISKAKFTVDDWEPRRMAEIGDGVLASVMKRWDRAVDYYGNPAPPLAESYRKYKVDRRKLPGIRDWKLRGILRRSMKTLVARANVAIIGPIQDAVSYTLRKRNGRAVAIRVVDVLRINNRRSNMWGLSEQDRAEFLRLALQGKRILRIEKAS